MRMIPEWRRAWRMFSQQAFVLATALQGVWVTLDGTQRSSLSPNWIAGITIAILVAGFVGRLVVQDSIRD